MNQTNENTIYARLRIRMERPFGGFGQKEKEEFLKDLSHITGFPKNKFRSIKFRPGCIIFEGDLDIEAARRICELYEKRKKGISTPEMEELREMLEKYGISDITDDLTIRISIRPVRRPVEKQIIFVHGWLGDKESFGELPSYLAHKLDCQSSVYEYPTGVWRESPSLEFISRNLDNWIRNHADAKRIAIVAHSMGGLVARKLLISQDWREEPLDKRVKQATFIASPHNGAVLARLLEIIPLLRKAQLSELNPNSPFLIDLNTRWINWWRENVPKFCRIRSIYGTADNIVSATNALGLDPEAVPILNADHTDVVKPRSEKDEIVLTIERFLRESSFVN